MRVVVVVHGFPPRAQGGSELYAEALARALRAQHDDDILVVTREQDASRPEYAIRRETRDGLEIAWINNTFAEAHRFEDTYRNVVIDDLAARLIDEQRPDVAHVHHLTCLSTGIVPALAARHVPVVLTLHDYWLMCHRGQLLDVDLEPCDGPGETGCGACAGPAGAASPALHGAARAFRQVEPHLPEAVRGALRRTAGRAVAGVVGPAATRAAEAARAAHMREVCAQVSAFLAPSRYIAGAFERFGVLPGRIRHWPYGVEAPAARARRQPPDGRPMRVAFVGSLMVSKAPHLLLEAVGALTPGRVEAHVFGEFVPYHGDDSYRAHLAPLLDRPGVVGHGRQPRESVARAVATMDAVVVPSIWAENSPLVIHEALAAGVPVVAAAAGGIPELVTHGRNGLLFEPGDASALRAQIGRLVSEPGLLDTLARGARPVRSMRDDAAATHWLFESLAERARASAPRRPARAAVILNFRTPGETTLAVRSVLASRVDPGDVIVADNAATGECAAVLASLAPRVRVLELSSNRGFSGGINAGLRSALARGAARVLIMNSDAVVAPDCLAKLDAALDAEPSAGIAAPVVLARSAPDEVATLGMRYDPRTGRMRHLGVGARLDALEPLPAIQVADAVSGCVMLVRREVFDAVGLFDEAYFFSFEDLEFCLRARRAGFRSIVVGQARAWHEGGRTIGADSPRRLYFAARNHLRAARQISPDVGGLAAAGRTAAVVGFNLAHALRARGASAPVRLFAVLRGTFDYARGRFGSGDSA